MNQIIKRMVGFLLKGAVRIKEELGRQTNMAGGAFVMLD